VAIDNAPNDELDSAVQDAEQWEIDTDELTIAPRLGATISVRFDPATASLIRRAARLQGRSQSAFVREAAEESARSTIAKARVVLKVRGHVAPMLRANSELETTLPAHSEPIAKVASVAALD
jgi:uncharacterized protein (DUF1778 family)